MVPTMHLDYCTMRPLKKHLLVIGLPLVGHSGPLFELAKNLSNHVAVTFAASGYFIEDLRNNPSHEKTPEQSLEFFRFDDGDKPDFTNSKAHLKMYEVLTPMIIGLTKNFRHAGENAEPQEASLLPIDAILVDNFLARAMEEGFKCGLPIYFFNRPAVGFLQLFMMLREDAPVIPAEEVPDFEPFPKAGGPPAPITTTMKHTLLPIRKFLPLAKGILENSFLSIDKEGLERVKEDPLIGHIPVYFVGPLIPVSEKSAGAQQSTYAAIHKWLSRQRPRSVIYISFGSMAVPADDQIGEIAHALLEMNQPFVWSLQEQGHHNLPEQIRRKMEKQFDPDSEFFILPWVPQKTILADPAVAVMISHCGWNGVLESVSAGVPLVAWPMFAEQLINAEWLVTNGVALLIPGTGIRRGRIVPAKEIVQAIAEVVGLPGQTNKFLEAAKYWAEEARLALTNEGSSSRDLLRFIASL